MNKKLKLIFYITVKDIGNIKKKYYDKIKILRKFKYKIFFYIILLFLVL